MSIDDYLEYDNAKICQDNRYMIAIKNAESDYQRRTIIEYWKQEDNKVQYDRLRIYYP